MAYLKDSKGWTIKSKITGLPVPDMTWSGCCCGCGSIRMCSASRDMGNDVDPTENYAAMDLAWDDR